MCKTVGGAVRSLISGRSVKFLLILAIMISGTAVAMQAHAIDSAQCGEVGINWTPNPSPWHKSGPTTFTFNAVDNSPQYYPNGILIGVESTDITATCTTGPNNGDICTVNANTGRNIPGHFLDRSTNAKWYPATCVLVPTTRTSPPNNVDGIAPTCGAWSGFDSSGNNTLSGSTDTGGSGILVSGGTCNTACDGTCPVDISDHAGNTTSCTSPKRTCSNPNPPILPSCGATSQWTGDGNATPFFPTGATDPQGGTLTYSPASGCTAACSASCTVTVSNSGGSTSCTSPSRTANCGSTFTCSSDPATVNVGSSTTFSVLDTYTSPQNTGVYNWNTRDITAASTWPSHSTGAWFGTVVTSCPLGVNTSTVNASVTDQSGHTAKCAAAVNCLPSIYTPCLGPGPGIQVDSNLATTWNLSGPAAYTQSQPSTYQIYSSPPQGTYTLTPAPQSGYAVSVTPSNVDTYLNPPSGSGCTTLNNWLRKFHIIYTPVVGSAGSVNVNSTDPITWTVRYTNTQPPAVIANQTSPAKTGTYSNQQAGNYSIAIDYSNLNGKTCTVDNAAKALTDGGSITFNVNCQDVGVCQHSFAASVWTPEPGQPQTYPPQTGVIKVGEQAYFKSIWTTYDCLSTNVQIVTCGTNWKPGDATVARADNCIPAPINQSNSAEPYTGLKAGTTEAIAEYSGFTQSIPLTVLPADYPDISCAVDPDSFQVTEGVPIKLTGTMTCRSLNGFAGDVNFTSYDVVRRTYANAESLTLTAGGSASSKMYVNGTAQLLAGRPNPYTINILATPASMHDYPSTSTRTKLIPVSIRVVGNQLAATLTANPNAGDQGTLNSALTGGVTGGCSSGACPTSNFTYWADCPPSKYAGTSVSAADNACGGHLEPKFDNQTGSVTQLNHIYSVGSYTPLLIVERGSSAARATATVTVTAPQTHAECVSNTCVQVVNSAGNTADRCGTDADCGGGRVLCPDGSVPPLSGICPGTGKCADGSNPPCPGGGGDFHGECNAAQKACVNKSGAGPSTCASDPRCGGPGGDSYLACQDNACVIVGGTGTNEGGCTAVGQNCTTPTTTGTCTITANPKVIKSGNNSNVTWTCSGGVKNCALSGPNIINQGSGTAIVKPGQTSQYTLTCNRGTYSVPVTVYVVQSFKEVPPGGQ